MSGPQKGPLSGVRVLELARVLAGPWAGQTLADLGAEVIKVERPVTGDDTRAWGPPFMEDKNGGRLSSAYNLSCNRGKRPIAVDLESQVRRACQIRSRLPKPLGRKSAAGLLLDYRLRPGRPLQDPRRL